MHTEILFHWKLYLGAKNHLHANPFDFLKRSVIQKNVHKSCKGVSSLMLSVLVYNILLEAVVVKILENL